MIDLTRPCPAALAPPHTGTVSQCPSRDAAPNHAKATMKGGGNHIASIDWSQCPAVESIPGKVSGAWVFKDTRLPVATVIENLEDLSVDEVMEQFDVTREQINAVLDFVAQTLRTPAPEQQPAPVDAHPVLTTEHRAASSGRFPSIPL